MIRGGYVDGDYDQKDDLGNCDPSGFGVGSFKPRWFFRFLISFPLPAFLPEISCSKRDTVDAVANAGKVSWDAENILDERVTIC